MLEYKPTAHPELHMAVVTTEENNLPVSLYIYLKSRISFVSPADYVTDNSLVPEVMARAGLSEDYTLENFHIVAQSSLGGYYFATVSADIVA
jgi:hypothetical protein